MSEDVPTELGVLTGYRSWYVGRDGNLHSLTMASNFHSSGWYRHGPQRPAFCWVSSHQAPRLRCDCGYWSYYQPYSPFNGQLSIRGSSSMARMQGLKFPVSGVVRAWGPTVLCTRGARSSYIEIVALSPTMAYGRAWRTMWHRIQEVGDRYGVPTYRRFSSMVESHPPNTEDENPVLPDVSLHVELHKVRKRWTEQITYLM